MYIVKKTFSFFFKKITQTSYGNFVSKFTSNTLDKYTPNMFISQSELMSTLHTKDFIILITYCFDLQCSEFLRV